MIEKKIYSAPLTFRIPVLAGMPLCDVSGVNNSEQGGHSITGKKHRWSTWDDDDVEDVGSSAGTGKSALELPSGGKLWDD